MYALHRQLFRKVTDVIRTKRWCKQYRLSRLHGRHRALRAPQHIATIVAVDHADDQQTLRGQRGSDCRSVTHGGRTQVLGLPHTHGIHVKDNRWPPKRTPTREHTHAHIAHANKTERR